MHKDQQSIFDILIPRLGELTASSEESTVRDCTVMNRLFLQGPDPLYLMETSPRAFSALCRRLNLQEENGREAILSAHERGPSILLTNHGGIPLDPDVADFHYRWHDDQEWRREGLWLLLASFSDCTEEEYLPSMTMLERIQRATAASARFESYTNSAHAFNVCWHVHTQLLNFHGKTVIELDDRGIPHVTTDVGFYLAYKAGHRACVYESPKGLKFYGTIASTSLDAEGIVVDKKISEQYGIVFPPES